MALTRHIKWAAALDTLIHARAATPFSWGDNDCCLFVGDAVKEMTGTDIAAEFRGKYTDAAGANAVIQATVKSANVADIAAYVANLNDMAEVRPLQAQRGDMVVLDGGGGLALAIVSLDGLTATGVGESGLMRVPLKRVVRAWRV
jgi:hypothetical protein